MIERDHAWTPQDQPHPDLSRLRWDQQTSRGQPTLLCQVDVPRLSQGESHHKAKPDRGPGKFVHIKDFTIFIFADAAVAIGVTDDEPKADERAEHWDDELQQLLDDYD